MTLTRSWSIDGNGRMQVSCSGTRGASGAAQEEAFVFSLNGAVADGAGKSRLYLENSYTLVSVRAAVGTAPSGGTEIVDINKNGTTIYGTQGNRPSIANGGFAAVGGAASVTTFAPGDYLTVDVDADGTATSRATDLTVAVRLLKV